MLAGPNTKSNVLNFYRSRTLELGASISCTSISSYAFLTIFRAEFSIGYLVKTLEKSAATTGDEVGQT
jgi:hypothetical protein